MTALAIAGVVLGVAAVLVIVFCLVDITLDWREDRRAAQRQAVMLLAQQRMRAVTRATLEAMRDTARTSVPSQYRNRGRR